MTDPTTEAAITDKQYRDAARKLYHIDGEIEIEEDAKVSVGDTGAYVCAWVYVGRTSYAVGEVADTERDRVASDPVDMHHATVVISGSVPTYQVAGQTPEETRSKIEAAITDAAQRAGLEPPA